MASVESSGQVRVARARSVNAWLWDLRISNGERSGASVVILPHAGGSAHGFIDWTKYVDPGVRILAVQYPGRGARLGEPLPTSVRAIAEPLVGMLSSFDGPLYVFGHSMGALVGFELVWALEQRGCEVRTFFASACRAPHAPNPCPIHSERMSDGELVAALRLRGGTEQEVLENADMRDIVLNIIRSDFTIDDDYEYGMPGRMLHCPIVAIGGDDDPAVPVGSLRRWGELSRTAQIHTMGGGHFYFYEHMPELMSIIHGEIRAPRRA